MINNFTILEDKIITSPYVIDMVNIIEKSQDKEKSKKVLLAEFSKLILQGKVTFLYLYCDRHENRIRGRVRSSAGFRIGTQRLIYIPSNSWPRKRSKNKTALRYYDFGRASWRSFRKDSFIVATSFWDAKENKWKDNPYEAGFTSNWNKIRGLNKVKDHKRTNEPDTPEIAMKKQLVAKKEAEKRERQIAKTQKKLRKSFEFDGGLIKLIN